jgi:hypothetical protein
VHWQRTLRLDPSKRIVFLHIRGLHLRRSLRPRQKGAQPQTAPSARRTAPSHRSTPPPPQSAPFEGSTATFVVIPIMITFALVRPAPKAGDAMPSKAEEETLSGGGARHSSAKPAYFKSIVFIYASDVLRSNEYISVHLCHLRFMVSEVYYFR